MNLKVSRLISVLNKRLDIHILFKVCTDGRRSHGILNDPRTNIIMQIMMLMLMMMMIIKIIILEEVLLLSLNRGKKLALHVSVEAQMVDPVDDIGARGVLGSAKGEVLVDEVELGLGELNLELKVVDDAVAAADGVGGSEVGLENDGAHGLVLGSRVEVLDDLGDVADAEELVGVEELALVVVREVRGQNAVGCALPPLVLTRRASLGTAVPFCCCRCRCR